MTGAEKHNLMKAIIMVFDADDELQDAVEADATPAKVKYLERLRLNAMEVAVTAGVSYEVIGRITGASPDTVRSAIQRRRKKKRERAERRAA